MRLQKKKRIEDRALIEKIKSHQSCVVCYTVPIEVDHITTRGAGGDDVVSNLLPTCRLHHRMRHDHGIKFMMDTFPRYRQWLIDHGRDDVVYNQKHEVQGDRE